MLHCPLLFNICLLFWLLIQCCPVELKMLVVSWMLSPFLVRYFLLLTILLIALLSSFSIYWYQILGQLNTTSNMHLYALLSYIHLMSCCVTLLIESVLFVTMSNIWIWRIILQTSVCLIENRTCEIICFFFLQDARLVYKHYATLYFVFIFDSSENELAMLDLIQGTFLIGNSNYFVFPPVGWIWNLCFLRMYTSTGLEFL